MSDLPFELKTLVERYGSSVLDDADGLRATLDDFLEDNASPGEVNLIVDAVRFGSLERLRSVLGQGADPRAATADVAETLAQRRGGDGDSAYWACAVLGYAAGLLPGELIPGTWMRPPSATEPSAGGAASVSTVPHTGGETFDSARTEPATRDERTQRSPADPAGGRVGQEVPATPSGPAANGTTDGRGRRTLWYRVAMAAALVLVVALAVVFWTRQRDTSTPAAGNLVPVAAIVPAFGHFGPDGGLAKALASCGTATIPGEKYQNYNCSFASKYGPFDLELTEKNPEILNRTDLPDIVRRPPANTIVTSQQGQDNYHAYFMELVSSGKDAAKNTPDDEVKLTLYDVDPSHPGAAIFTAKDAGAEPLTHEKADSLLLAIGASDEAFPLPKAFRTESLARFAQPFVSAHPDGIDCVPAFSVFNGELEHDTCRGEDVSVAFGVVGQSNLDRIRYRFRSNTGDDYTWSSASGSGKLTTSTFRGSTRLYWDNGSQSYGVLVAKTAERNARKLIAYFTGFGDSPKVTASAP